MDDWFPGDMKAARFAVYIDKFVKVKFMDIENRMNNIAWSLIRIENLLDREAGKSDKVSEQLSRIDEIEGKLDRLLDHFAVKDNKE